MAAVKFLRDVTIAPRQMLFLLSSLVTADDKDAEEMARTSRFDDPFFDQLRLGIMAQDLDVLAEAINSYLPDVGYLACRRVMLERIATATRRRIISLHNLQPLNYVYTDAAQSVVENIIGDARLDRWIGYSILAEEIEVLRNSVGTFSKADEKRVQSWLAAAKRAGETGMRTTPSVEFKTADRRRAAAAGGQAIAIGWDAYSFAVSDRKSATQNALVELANRVRKRFEAEYPNDRQAVRDAIAEEVAIAVERAILSFPPRRP